MFSRGFHRTDEEGLSAKNDEEANNPVSERHTDARTCRSSAHQSEETPRGVAIHSTSGALALASGCIESPQGARAAFYCLNRRCFNRSLTVAARLQRALPSVRYRDATVRERLHS